MTKLSHLNDTFARDVAQYRYENRKTIFAHLPREEWPTRVRRLVSEQLSLILRRSIDPDRPISEYGLDSLGNLEVRTRIETGTGIRISPADITTVRNLAAHLYDALAAQADAPAAT